MNIKSKINKSISSFTEYLLYQKGLSQNTVDSYSHQIFTNPEFPSKRKRRATPFGAGYTEYQPEIIFLDLFRGKNVFFVEPIVKPQNTKVLLNLYRQPYFDAIN